MSQHHKGSNVERSAKWLSAVSSQGKHVTDMLECTLIMIVEYCFFKNKHINNRAYLNTLIETNSSEEITHRRIRQNKC